MLNIDLSGKVAPCNGRGRAVGDGAMVRTLGKMRRGCGGPLQPERRHGFMPGSLK